MSDPWQFKPAAATKDVVGRRWHMLCSLELHLLSLSLYGNNDRIFALLADPSLFFLHLLRICFAPSFSMERTILILAGPQSGKPGWHILLFWWKTLGKFHALQYTNKSLNLLESEIIGILGLLKFCCALHFWTKFLLQCYFFLF